MTEISKISHQMSESIHILLSVTGSAVRTRGFVLFDSLCLQIIRVSHVCFSEEEQSVRLSFRTPAVKPGASRSLCSGCGVSEGVRSRWFVLSRGDGLEALVTPGSWPDLSAALPLSTQVWRLTLSSSESVSRVYFRSTEGNFAWWF